MPVCIQMMSSHAHDEIKNGVSSEILNSLWCYLVGMDVSMYNSELDSGLGT